MRNLATHYSIYSCMQENTVFRCNVIGKSDGSGSNGHVFNINPVTNKITSLKESGNVYNCN